MQAAFYDEKKTYEQNYIDGPPISRTSLKPPRQPGKLRNKFLGHTIRLPFGIPAGPLLNSQYIKAAFEWGYDVSTYKTVRADEFPCHQFPNVLYVDVKGELHPDKTPQLVANDNGPMANDQINITNSFGVPSRKPRDWQQDVKKALSFEKKDQLLILSFMGTVKLNQTQEEFIADFAKAAKLAKETGVKVLEANLSCPNIGNEGLVCYNTDVTEQICEAVRKEIGDTPLILKVGYYKDLKQLEQIAQIADNYAQAVAAINTLQVEVVDTDGNQALPGKMRLKSGVCGAGIKWAGLEMTDRLSTLRSKNKYSYEIIGVGGVMSAKDYDEYISLGANLVQSATGAMWNPFLAEEIHDAIVNS